MELTSKLVAIIQEGILNPGFGTALAVFIFAFLSELVAVFPSAIILSSPLLTLENGLSPVLLTKLILLVGIPFSLGNVLGSVPLYVISYFGGKPAIEKFQKYLRFSWKDVERIENRFQGLWYDEILFFLLRAVPFIPTLPVNIAAGILRMNPVAYVVLTTLGIAVRMAVMFMLAGWGGDNLSL